MKLDTLGLQAFTAIVEHGTFHKAAQALNISQTGLSRRLKTLEGALGVRLIDRTTRAWTLTVVGRDFLPRAQRLLQDLTAAIGTVKDAARRGRGDVTIACVTTIACDFLPDIIVRYSRAYPGNRVRLLDVTTPAVLDAVLQRQAEFGINILTTRHPDLTTLSLLEDPFVMICRDDHPLSRKGRVAWKELLAHEVILLSRRTGNGMLLDNALNQLGMGLPSAYEVQHPSTALSLVAAGAGIAILPRLTLRRGADVCVRAIPLRAPVVRRELGLIHRKDVTLSPAALALYTLIRQTLTRR